VVLGVLDVLGVLGDDLGALRAGVSPLIAFFITHPLRAFCIILEGIKCILEVATVGLELCLLTIITPEYDVAVLLVEHVSYSMIIDLL
jgi:hypothetical protein